MRSERAAPAIRARLGTALFWRRCEPLRFCSGALSGEGGGAGVGHTSATKKLVVLLPLRLLSLQHDPLRSAVVALVLPLGTRAGMDMLRGALARRSLADATAGADCGMSAGGGFALGFLGGIFGMIVFLLMRKRWEIARGRRMTTAAVKSGSGITAAGGGDGLSSGWTEATDPNSGRIYYYQASTGATSWTKPMA